MGTYMPIWGMGLAGAVIDPENLQRELTRIAKAHNTHAVNDFTASCISNAALDYGKNYFYIPFGVRGSWNLGAVTLTGRIASMGIPYSNMVLCGGYVMAEDLNATTTYKLYYDGVLKEAVSVTDGTPTTAHLLTNLAATPLTTTQDDILDIRASGTLTVKNLIFWLKVYAPHTT